MTDSERRINDLLTCIARASGQYNKIEQLELSSAESVTLPKDSFHSLGFNLGSGATLDINNGTNTVTYTTNGSVTVTSLNETPLTLTAVGGAVALMWTNK